LGVERISGRAYQATPRHIEQIQKRDPKRGRTSCAPTAEPVTWSRLKEARFGILIPYSYAAS
jgi:hypothetical protein